MENVFRFCLFQFGQICQYDKYICAVISLQNLLNLTLYIMINKRLKLKVRFRKPFLNIHAFLYFSPPHLSTLQSKGCWSLS